MTIDNARDVLTSARTGAEYQSSSTSTIAGHLKAVSRVIESGLRAGVEILTAGLYEGSVNSESRHELRAWSELVDESVALRFQLERHPNTPRV